LLMYTSVVKHLWEVFVWGVVLVVCVCVSVSGVLFSVGVCVCDLLIFLTRASYDGARSARSIRCCCCEASCAYMLNTRGERMKYGILFIFSLFYEYSNLAYVHIHVIYRVNQAEYGIHIRVAASQEYVNIYSTRRLERLRSEAPTVDIQRAHKHTLVVCVCVGVGGVVLCRCVCVCVTC